jgi:D-glycero-D-manno-heptose 1,7-bisphosphate phosphatase
MGETAPRAGRLRRAVFLDRDGTLIRDRHHLGDPEGVELLPGTAETLAALQAVGALLVVVSNQSGIGRGLYTAAAVERVNERLASLLAEHGISLDGIYVCPHAPDDGCDCRKPQPGLLVRAADELGIDLAASILVGDAHRDIEAAAAVGVQALRVRKDAGLGDVAAELREAFARRD